MRRTIGRPFDAELDIYDVCKYEATVEQGRNRKKEIVTDVIEWEIKEPEDKWTKQHEADTKEHDDYHEYLVLYKTDGQIRIFRNSYVDMFRI
jgi:hypothetical protein